VQLAYGHEIIFGDLSYTLLVFYYMQRLGCKSKHSKMQNCLAVCAIGQTGHYTGFPIICLTHFYYSLAHNAFLYILGRT